MFYAISNIFRKKMGGGEVKKLFFFQKQIFLILCFMVHFQTLVLHSEPVGGRSRATEISTLSTLTTLLCLNIFEILNPNLMYDQ